MDEKLYNQIYGLYVEVFGEETYYALSPTHDKAVEMLEGLTAQVRAMKGGDIIDE